MRHSLLLAALLVAASSTARAETPALKDPTTATLTSVGATLLPIVVGAAIVKDQDVAGTVLIGAGLILGPSLVRRRDRLGRAVDSRCGARRDGPGGQRCGRLLHR